MFSASKYAPGLIGVGILWILANSMTNSWVEKDLTSRAAAAIPPEALDKPGVAVSGRDATLLGSAFSAADSEGAKTAVDATKGVRLVRNATTTLALAKPYVFSATRDGNKIVLAGNVPDPAARANTLAAARLAVPAGEVVDQMTYAAGANSGFGVQSGFALAELANFSKASSSLSDGSYSLSGEAASQAGFDAASASVKKLADGMTLAKAEILPSAAQVAAAKAAADAVAKEAAAKAAADAVAKEAAAKAAADAAAKDAAAKVAADAVAKEAAAKAAADAAAKPAPAGNTAVAAVAVDETVASTEAAGDSSPLDSKACQSKFNAQLLEGTIEFQTGKANLHPGSEKFLDLLVKTGLRCPKARIEVAGYTDSVGSAEANVELSAHRAETVMHYLVKAGLDANLLTAKGYGEASPVAANDTPEGRAKNRRIEFNVQD